MQQTAKDVRSTLKNHLDQAKISIEYTKTKSLKKIILIFKYIFSLLIYYMHMEVMIWQRKYLKELKRNI